MSLKKMVMGQEMPSKDDPKYQERYQREKEAGMKFAEKSGINFLASKVQLFANSHRVAFLALVFGIVIGCFAINVFNMVKSYQNRSRTKATAVEQVDSALQKHQYLNKSMNDENN